VEQSDKSGYYAVCLGLEKVVKKVKGCKKSQQTCSGLQEFSKIFRDGDSNSKCDFESEFEFEPTKCNGYLARRAGALLGGC
jgi:hypothetical protein